MNNFDNIKKENEALKEKLLLLEKENIELKGCLKKYTSPSRNNETYKQILNKMKETPISPDKKQKYKNYYYLKNLLLKTDDNSI